jgi:hypothetical protein
MQLSCVFFFNARSTEVDNNIVFLCVQKHLPKCLLTRTGFFFCGDTYWIIIAKRQKDEEEL